MSSAVAAATPAAGALDAGGGAQGDAAIAANPLPPPVVSPPPEPPRSDAKPILCEKHVVRAQSIAPEMLIILDKSASMTMGRRWDPSRQAVQTLVTEFDSQIAFGLSMFPGGMLGLCEPGELDVPIKTGTGMEITRRANTAMPAGITPTAQTLENALRYMGTREPELDGPGRPPGYVVLVTDGEPNCADPMHPDPVQSSVAAVSALRQAMVKTFVIGYGIQRGLGTQVMDRLAVAGGTEHYYAVEDQQGLLDAFHEITKSIVSCTFELSEVPVDPRYVRVVLDGNTVVLNEADGWVIDGKVVTLQGGSCSTLRNGEEHQLESHVECTPVSLL